MESNNIFLKPRGFNIFISMCTILLPVLLSFFFNYWLYHYCSNENGIRIKKPKITQNTIKLSIIRLGSKPFNKDNEVEFTFLLRSKEFKIKNLVKLNQIPANPYLQVTNIYNGKNKKEIQANLKKKQKIRAPLKQGVYEFIVEYSGNTKIEQNHYYFNTNPVPKPWKWADIFFKDTLLIVFVCFLIFFILFFILFLLVKKTLVKEKRSKKEDSKNNIKKNRKSIIIKDTK